MRKEYKELKDVKRIKAEHIVEYVQHRQEDRKSAYTIGNDMEALNKLFNFNVIKKDAGIKQRLYKDITRSRGEKAYDKKYNPDNYRNQILLAKDLGCRRESILLVKTEHFSWQGGLPVGVYLKEKGGKEREAPILEKYQSNIKQKLESKCLISTLKNDNHSFRREYVKERYTEILDERDDNKESEVIIKKYWKKYL